MFRDVEVLAKIEKETTLIRPDEVIALPLLPFEKPQSIQRVAGLLHSLAKNPVPPQWIKSRPIGDGKIAHYIPSEIIKMLLNRVFGIGHWGYEILEEKLIPRKAGGQDWLVRLRLWGEAVDNDGTVVQFSLGEETGGAMERASQTLDMSDFRESAISKAIRRCIVKRLFPSFAEQVELSLLQSPEGQKAIDRVIAAQEHLGWNNTQLNAEIVRYVKEKFDRTVTGWKDLSASEKAVFANHIEKMVRESPNAEG